MGYCTNCGMEIKDGAKFCTNCGAPQKPAAEEPHMQYGQTQQTEPVQQEPWQNNNSYDFTGAQGSADSSFGSAGAADSYDSYGNSGSYTNAGGSNSNYGSTGSYSNSGTYSSMDNSSTGGYGSAGSSYSNAGSSYGSTGGYSSVGSSSEPVPAPGFMEAVQTCFSKYATFSGRARRSEYWYFTLFHMLGYFILGILGNMIFGAPRDGGANMLQSIFTLALLVPGLSVGCRRLHDIGKSGKWLLLSFVPLIGWIVLLVFEIKDSEPGENQYGRSPKYPG